MLMKIDVTNKGKDKTLEQWLKRRAKLFLMQLSKRRVPAASALQNASLSILLTNDKEIHLLNKQWRGKDRPTDVLSFPQENVVGLLRKTGISPWELGDIVISLDRAKEQAKEKKHSYRRELEWLLAHGLLHLLGFDHEISQKEAVRMRRMEKVLLTR